MPLKLAQLGSLVAAVAVLVTAVEAVAACVAVFVCVSPNHGRHCDHHLNCYRFANPAEAL